MLVIFGIINIRMLVRIFSFGAFLVFFIGIALLSPSVHAAGLESRVNEAFRSVFSRNPTPTENAYWAGRVARKEKNTFTALQGAMFFHKAQNTTVGGSSTTPSPSSVASTDKQSLIKIVLPLFVQIYGNDPTNAEKAWWRKRISCNEIKNQSQLDSSMRWHKAKSARQGSAAICGNTAAGASTSLGGVIRRAVAGISSHPMGDTVRIGIHKTDGQAIHVSANGSYQIREGANKVLGTLGKDDIVQVSFSGGKYHVRGSGVSFDTVNKIRLVPLNQAIMKIHSYSDPSPTIPGKNYNRFRGIIEIRKCDECNELWAINELRTEYYLRGLAETSGQGPEEYLKALSIAARTYVLYHKVITGGRKVQQDFDIGKTSDDQVYRGYEYEIITPRMSSIFNKVRGIIATNGEGDVPVSTIYFSDSDGRTRSAKEKWNSSRFPHLQSVKDPHHASSACKGHCVGMSAQGAYGFAAKDSWSFQKILTYYFNGIKLVKAY